MAFAGGWIDQPFYIQTESKSTRFDGGGVFAAYYPFYGTQRDGNQHPQGGDEIMGRETCLIGSRPNWSVNYMIAENNGKPEPSGSQDMAGIIYPGVNRLDYDYDLRRRVFSGACRILQ